MHTKIASLWRFIRTPALLTSTTVLLISCASKNPLIDEVEQPKKGKSVVSATTDEKPARTGAVNEPEPKKTKPAVSRVDDTELVSESENELNKQPEGMKKWISKLTPYKVDIQQGNFVSSEMLAKLKPGMTKEQVRFVLGTPLLTDIFHANRWDYLFRLQKPNGSVTTNRVTVFFRDNLVERIANDNLPGEAQYLSHIAGDKPKTEKVKESSAKENKTSEKKAPPVVVSEKETSASPQKSAPSLSATNEPVSIPESEKATEPVTVIEAVKAAEPVKTVEPVKTIEPVRIVEPVQAAETVKVVEPVDAPASQPQATTTRKKRPDGKKPVQTNSDDETASSQNNMKSFEPISIPNRTNKMLPPSPNDQLIGNIQ